MFNVGNTCLLSTAPPLAIIFSRTSQTDEAFPWIAAFSFVDTSDSVCHDPFLVVSGPSTDEQDRRKVTFVCVR